MVIGSDVIPQILTQGLYHVADGTLLAQNTIFGWIISGPIAEKVTSFTTQVMEPSNDALNTLLKKFWEQEEVYPTQPRSKEDEYCENLYVATTTRQENGRYVVKLPFKQEFPTTTALGHSRPAAQQQYLSVESTLQRKPELRDKYNEVLEEYVTLDHMTPSSATEIIREG
ncbi:uncharacterized protein LOC118756287, partial [Rhagoletis pomonella]|uniref:uncharacterized protein LOC118756175 n=1 Tax=Rhagoletis pomonella TaxID=28610 RepID=UPI0017848BC7